MPDEIILTLAQLRSLIGLRMQHLGELCQVIEVLENGPALVLQSLAPQPGIQPNQHGEANRFAPITYTISVLNHDRSELHPDYLALELIE